MSLFLNKLTSKFHDFVESQWHETTEHKRLDFNFLPIEVALQLLNFVKTHPIVTRYGSIPLILRNQEKDEPILLDNCNGQELRDDQILRLRNNNPTCLVGVRPGEILEKSLDSDSVPNPFKQLQDELFFDWFQTNELHRDEFGKLIDYVNNPRNSKVRDEILLVRKWNLLKALHDLDVKDCSKAHVRSLAILGGIMIPVAADDFKQRLVSMHACLNMIGKSLEAGIQRAFTDWSAKANDIEIKTALDEYVIGQEKAKKL